MIVNYAVVWVFCSSIRLISTFRCSFGCFNMNFTSVCYLNENREIFLVQCICMCMYLILRIENSFLIKMNAVVLYNPTSYWIELCKYFKKNYYDNLI